MLFCYFPSLSLEACYVDIAIFLVCLRRRAIFAIIACYFTIFLVCFRRRAILLTIAIFFVCLRRCPILALLHAILLFS